MAITFRCPKCKNLCAFAQQHAGRRARCTNCNERFIIPDADGQAAKVEITEEPPLPGFYRRTLIESWKVFTKLQNAKILIFFAFMVSLEYFIGYTDFSTTLPGFRFQLPLGIITIIVTRGCLFAYYFQIVATAAFAIDEMPDIELGSGLDFLWDIIKSIYLFAVAFLIPLLPFSILATIIESFTSSELPDAGKIAFLLAGSFFFPMVILTLAAGREFWMVFNPVMIIGPIFKAFPQYLTTVLLTWGAILIQWATIQYTMGGYQEMSKKGPLIAAVGLLVCIATRVLNIITMRAIGLFAYHYRSYLPQTHLKD